MRRWRQFSLTIGALTLAVSGAELTLRALSFGDFPLIRPDPVVGYLPQANQRGRYRGRAWAFNELSMGVARPFRPSAQVDTLLLGDSLVYGGILRPQSERLGPQLETAIGAPVWPISAESWALANELAYLRQRPGVVEDADRVVFVLNSADFGRPSTWSSDVLHPTRRPRLLTFYVLAQPLRVRGLRAAPAPLTTPNLDWLSDWQALVRSGKPILVVLYPDRSEVGSGRWAETLRLAQRLSAPNVTLLDVGASPAWRQARLDDLYDDYIHPTPAGAARLAGIIAQALRIDGAAAAPIEGSTGVRDFLKASTVHRGASLVRDQ